MMKINKSAPLMRGVTEAVGAGKTLLFIDETNVNLFMRRDQDRSPRGSRCVMEAAITRGPNIHVIGAMTQTWHRLLGGPQEVFQERHVQLVAA